LQRSRRRRNDDDDAESAKLARKTQEQRGERREYFASLHPRARLAETCHSCPCVGRLPSVQSHQVLIERRLRWVKRQLEEGDDEGLQVALLLIPSFSRHVIRKLCVQTVFVTRPQSNMQHLLGTQTKLKEMQITILKLALMAQKKHEMEVLQPPPLPPPP
jgi:hypothetical protein